jgi:phosphohistidine phosphatase
MKTLLLLRHAKSSWKDESLSDHERPLNKRGKQAAPKMGHLMKKHDLVPDLVLSSTAVRARKTAEAAAKASGYEGSIVFLEELYLATASGLLEQASAVPDEEVGTVLLVAHNPGMEELVNLLSGRREAFPTAALAVFHVAIDKWRDLDLGADARLVNLYRPRETS